eukprot:m.303138 g.303138  ORF g.303138 m.303138 type:complete len:1301 (+) comp15892_c0_seq7:76-3978(+)
MTAYLQNPHVCGDHVAFICENDVWTVTRSVKAVQSATRVTNDHCASNCLFSPDGEWIAYTSKVTDVEQVYVVPRLGGRPQQVTNIPSKCTLVAWTLDGSAVVVCTDAREYAPGFEELYHVPVFVTAEPGDAGVGVTTTTSKFVNTPLDQALGYGHLHHISFNPLNQKQFVCGRHTLDPIQEKWKGYRGGRSGMLFITENGGKSFSKLSTQDGVQALDNLSCPAFGPDHRIYLCAELVTSAQDSWRQATGNVFSLLPSGQDLKQHTAHDEFYARHLAIDATAKVAVYQCAGQLWQLDLNTDESQPLLIRCATSKLLVRPYITDPLWYYSELRMHPLGHAMLMVTRGHLFSLTVSDGPAIECVPPRKRSSKAKQAQLAKADVTLSAQTKRKGKGQANTDEQEDGDGDGDGDVEDEGEKVDLEGLEEAQPIVDFSDLSVSILAADYLGDGEIVALCTGPSSDVPFQLVKFVHESTTTPTVEVAGISSQRVEIKSSTSLAKPSQFVASPCSKNHSVAYCTDTTQLHLIRIKSKGKLVTEQTHTASLDVIDSSDVEDGIYDPTWSHDGGYLAYVKLTTDTTSIITLYRLETKARIQVTCGVYMEYSPCFSYCGNYLYFLSQREFEPIEDELQFGYSFTKASKPFVLALSQDALSPFYRRAKAPGACSDESDDDSTDDDCSEEDSDVSEEDDGVEKSGFGDPVRVDEAGLQERLASIPVPTGIYSDLQCLSNGSLLYIRREAQSELVGRHSVDEDPDDDEDGVLFRFDFETKSEVRIANKVETAVGSYDGNSQLVLCLDGGEYSLYGMAAGEAEEDDLDPDELEDEVSVDDRIVLEIDPLVEWQSMYAQAWLYAHRQFWDPDMNGVDWHCMYTRFKPLLARISCRSEFEDVLLELLSELRSSHAYISEGDNAAFGGRQDHYRTELATLGCDYTWSERDKGYIVCNILQGDVWREDGGPLAKLGTGLMSGDVLLAINGRKLTRSMTPTKLLRHCAGKKVALTFKKGNKRSHGLVAAFQHLSLSVPSTMDKEQKSDGSEKASQTTTGRAGKETKQGKEKQKSKSKKHLKAQKALQAQHTAAAHLKTCQVTPLTLENLLHAQYRDWVTHNQRLVHTASQSQIGYVHVPDMEETGFAEFHRYFLVESSKPGLIVDIRWNEGGFVSELLLEKLSRRVLGWEVPRYARRSQFPSHAVQGPIVLLVDENTSSDGDIMAHTFRQLKLGTIVGKRTWGGSHATTDETMLDGTELYIAVSAFKPAEGLDTIENKGVDVDVEVDILPHHAKQHVDPQLSAAVQVCLDQLHSDQPPPP